ncbi:tyrosine-type recombinase/integrase [Butyrivibrio sp. AC2005]|uniref:tyrosine-type recombinase/integrase n=1 Tax=Butyrivibrio sp. AC2005 TaxID=1280672 RepID=UPI0003FFF891|nr:tyrosine-type recombinase/integrase [Butyrivibrio sp. AC2005]
MDRSTQSFTISEITLLLSSGTMEPAMVQDMLTVAKKNYVLSRHSQSIAPMPHAKGRKKGMWKTYVYVEGKRKEFLGKDEFELYDKLYDYYTKIDNASKTLISVFEQLCSYKKTVMMRSQNTIDDDRSFFSNVSTELQTSAIQDITEDDVRYWIVNDFVLKHPKVSRFKKTLQLLDQVFEYGRRKKACTENPMSYIPISDYLRYCDTSKKTDEEKAFSENELRRISEDTQSQQSNPRALMALLAMETGCRAGELPAIHVDDINDDYIHIHRQQLRESDPETGKNRIYEVSYTKDERTHPHDGRYIPLTDKAKAVIKAAHNIPGKSVYLFHDPNSDAMVTKDSYSHNLRKRCLRLGCVPTNNHAFRMAFNSRLIRLGFSADDRALILGHEVQTNESHYSLTDKRRLDEIKSRLK